MRVHDAMTRHAVTVQPDTSLDEIIELMEEGDVRHFPVTLDGVLGIVSDRDVLEATGWLPDRLFAARGVPDPPDRPRAAQDVMTMDVHTATADEDLGAACEKMLRNRVGCLPVVRGKALEGILTETDVLRAYAEQCASAPGDDELDPPVSERMTTEVQTLRFDAQLGDAVQLLSSLGIRHVPVVQEGHVLGMVSDRDVRRAVGAGRKEDFPVLDLYAGPPISVGPGATLGEAARTLRTQRIGALPVIDNELLVGIVTIADVLEHCARATSFRA